MAYLPRKEKYAFSTALMGQTMIYNFVNLYLMIFYTDVLGISAAAAGTLFLVARVWDAVNDPLMGVVVDKTKTRLGKCRPYILYCSLPIALFTVLLFTNPDLSPVMKIVYASVTYILWGMAYTAVDIPLWTLSSRMTADSNERKSLIASGRIFNVIGSALPVFLVIPLKMLFGRGDEAKGYFWAIVAFCIVAVPLLLQGFFGTTERVMEMLNKKEHKVKVKDILDSLFKNQPLLLLLLSSLLSVLINLPITAGIFYATYNLGDEGYMALLAGTVLVASGIGCGIAPALGRRYTGRNILIATSAMASFLFVIAYFACASGNMVLIVLLTFIIGVLLGIPLVLRTSMMADTIEYAQAKTGVRNEGIIFASLTFVSKLKMGAASFFVGMVLKFSGYIPNIEQTPEALNGIMLTMTLLPALGAALSVIPMLFYTLTDQEHKKIIEQLC